MTLTLEQTRPFIFIGLTLLMFILQWWKPSYKHLFGKRLLTNYSMLVLSIGLLKIVFPAGLAAISEKIDVFPWHLSNFSIALDFILTVIIFDLAIYWQHRLFHRIKWLWNFHAIHHSDLTLDASSAVRFHPGEIALSGGYKLLLIIIIGPRLETFLTYEILLSSFAIFNHSNFKISENFESKLRYLFVTPQMHYPHHSPHKEHTNTNYGNIFSFWDKLFNTYNKTKNSNFGLIEFPKEEYWRNIRYPFDQES